MSNESILLFYKNRGATGGMITIPFKSLDKAKDKANYLYLKGHTGIKISRVIENIEYIPSSEVVS